MRIISLRSACGWTLSANIVGALGRSCGLEPPQSQITAAMPSSTHSNSARHFAPIPDFYKLLCIGSHPGPGASQQSGGSAHSLDSTGGYPVAATLHVLPVIGAKKVWRLAGLNCVTVLEARDQNLGTRSSSPPSTKRLRIVRKASGSPRLRAWTRSPSSRPTARTALRLASSFEFVSHTAHRIEVPEFSFFRFELPSLATRHDARLDRHSEEQIGAKESRSRFYAKLRIAPAGTVPVAFCHLA